LAFWRTVVVTVVVEAGGGPVVLLDSPAREAPAE